MGQQEVSVRAWSGDEGLDEASIRRLMQQEGLQPYAWSNAPGDVYGAHSHAYHKVIYVVEGSITFGLPDSDQEVHLTEGDRLDLPPGVRHDAVVGPRGVLCLEAHR